MPNVLQKVLASKWLVFLLFYLGLLVVSNGMQLISSDENKEEIVESFVENPRIVYIQDPVLSEQRTSLKPDEETLFIDLESVSIQKNAERIQRYLALLSVSDFHLIGEGIGGSVAMHLASKADSIGVISLTLIDSHGVVELELMGGSTLNKAIYSTKKAVLGFIQYAVPHFSRFNFLSDQITKLEIQANSDQQKIRTVVKEIEVPVSIIQSPNSNLSIALVEEHHRIIPQSEIVYLSEKEAIWDSIAAFHQKVDAGFALNRSSISQATKILSLQPFDPENSIKAEGKALVILILVIIFSTFITEDLTCIGAGLLIARGIIGFIPGTLACLIGIFIGDILLYLLGRWVATGTLHKAPLKWFISENDLQLSYHWFEAKGPAIIIASRFIPGTRFPTYVSAGAIGAKFSTFILYFGIASILWTPVLVGLAVLLGNQMIEYFSVYQEYALWVFFGVITLLLLIVKVIVPAFSFKGRRLLFGKFRRIMSWEFWPLWVLYSPVLVYAVFLWIKHKSITLVTLANPVIEFGGFAGESKSEILRSLNQPDSVPAFQLIDPEDDPVDACVRFMEVHNLEFPVVLKPDVGERGKGVIIPKNKTDLKSGCFSFSSKFIIQKYVGGLEFGVFYVRFPNQEKGRIISITRKKYLWLTGDGKQTLEELILNDERAVCLAKIHFEQHVDHLFKVIPKGKKIKLVEIGTHSRGAIFKDAIHLNSNALTDKFDELCEQFKGFHFGRFDVKVPTETHLKEGSNINILEVNGITSEATHMYDPKYPYWYAVKTLCNQWKTAYAIAAQVKDQNKALTTPTLREVLSKVF
ncbi:MAG: VTT domain-containing protein [Balneolaceae bacterium]|nr:VTT domain-containing protein [Balneolaceae bacterium]